MRHRKKGRKLNRTASHRKALIRNLANQLFEHKEIRTTTAKAKEARPTVERLITYAKKGDLHHRRLAFSFLRQKNSINTLFDEIAPTFSDRQGGYTRIIKLGKRLGDGAQISLLQLVGFETLADTSKPEKKKKSRKKEAAVKETDTQVTEEVVQETAKETSVEEITEKQDEAKDTDVKDTIEEKQETKQTDETVEEVKGEAESATDKADPEPEENTEEKK